jgi:hypothetical protein
MTPAPDNSEVADLRVWYPKALNQLERSLRGVGNPSFLEVADLRVWNPETLEQL